MDLLSRHGYYYCYCCCCRRYLSQKVADGAAAVYPVDDRTESRNFSLVDCIARVLLQPVPVLVGRLDVEGPWSSTDGSTVGSRDVLAPHWDCICVPVKDPDLKAWGTSCEVQLFEHPFPVNSVAGTADTVGYSERDSLVMVGIVR